MGDIDNDGDLDLAIGRGSYNNNNRAQQIWKNLSFENKDSLFTLDINGTFKTATIFDYESNALNTAIRVQARDEYNATIERI